MFDCITSSVWASDKHKPTTERNLGSEVRLPSDFALHFLHSFATRLQPFLLCSDFIPKYWEGDYICGTFSLAPPIAKKQPTLHHILVDLSKRKTEVSRPFGARAFPPLHNSICDIACSFRRIFKLQASTHGFRLTTTTNLKSYSTDQTVTCKNPSLKPSKLRSL